LGGGFTSMEGGINKYNPNTQRPGGPLRPGDTPEAGGVKGSQQVQKAPGSVSEQQAIQQAAAQQQEIPTIVRKITNRDVVNQLLLLGIKTSDENRSLAMKMLLNGVELSKENFQKLLGLMRGIDNNNFTQQAAIMALKKGITNSTAVSQLAGFLKDNPQLANQLSNILNSLNSFNVLLNTQQQILSPTFTAQLAAILTQLEGSLAGLPNDIKRNMTKGGGLFSKSELLTNLRAAKSLLQGTASQIIAEDKPGSNIFLASLANLSKNMKSLMDNIMVQAILSKSPEKEDAAIPDQYAYWQIPNKLANPPKNIDLLVKKEKKKKGKINPRKTKLIIKTETTTLGEIAVELEIDGENIDIRFNANKEKTKEFILKNNKDLIERLGKHNYQAKTFRVVRRNLDIKKFLMPTLELDDLTRIQTEA